MKIHRVRGKAEYETLLRRESASLKRHRLQLETWSSGKTTSFSVPGFSYTAGKHVDFLVDFKHAGPGGAVNWRERVLCPVTAFNNRMRAAIHVFDLEMDAFIDSDIYITEQVTPMYKYFAETFSNVVGSEFLGSGFSPGSINTRGIRHEDVTKLSFNNGQFDLILSFDVLEHVPNFRKAFDEFYRVLRKDGKLLWTVPFTTQYQQNQIRARVLDGAIQHVLPPEYHGDPLNNGGCLCFTNFGWQMFDDVLEAGFGDVYAVCVQSAEFGYLGEVQQLFVAVK